MWFKNWLCGLFAKRTIEIYSRSGKTVEWQQATIHRIA